MNWTDILGNVASGGLLGLLGTGVNFVLGYFKQKQEHAQRLEWARDNRETLALEGQLVAARTAGDLAVAREKGASDAFTASQRADAAYGSGKSYKWVSAVRELTRPGLTVLLVVLTAIMRYSADPATRAYIDQNIVVTAVAAVTWWFGQRQLDRSSMSWGNQAAGASITSK
jgi:hypothetical protein